MEREENPIIELSISIVVGLTNPGTVKMKESINDEVVIVLINCGATHNFISDNLTTLLNLPKVKTSNILWGDTWFKNSRKR